jgi:plasmid stabilization system protein ParE
VNRPAVVEDISGIFDYYKQINPELAKQFLFRIREAKTYISHYPQSFQIKYKSVRTVLLKQFPYHINYIIDEEKMMIIVLAIIHAYKSPVDYSNR